MAVTSLGHHLINNVLPEKYHISGELTKSGLNKLLLAIAREMPDKYPDIVMKLKNLGDEVSTTEGVSVGLDDIAPVYDKRDAILKPAVAAFNKAKTDEERERIILDAQDKLLQHTKEHPGSMARMALSGARGNIPQLLKTVSSPVAATDAKGRLTPWLIKHSYAEGLSPSEYWVAGNEARINTVKSATSVAEPGDLAKIMINNLYPMVITQDDCGTSNGILSETADGQTLGRYLAKQIEAYPRNTLVTTDVVAALRTKFPSILVRSPLTCEAPAGICIKCQGLNEHAKPHTIGINVGVRAGQALSQPLTQFALNAKHGVRLLKGATKTVGGLQGVRQLIEIPQSFINKATLAETHGKVERIVEAPQGGNYVTVGGVEHYVSPLLNVTVKEGQKVEAGDALSEGIPKPDEVVKHKGLGAGRVYFADALYKLYRDQAGELDKRHFELLARAELNHLKILEHSSKYPQLVRGDVVSYPKFKEIIAEDAKDVPLMSSDGHILGRDVLHFTAGTTITPSIINTLKTYTKTVPVAEHAPRVEAVMRPMTRNPLLNPDWMARLSHRYLKDSFLKGVHYGEVSDIHGIHPVPAYAHGVEFGSGSDGRY